MPEWIQVDWGSFNPWRVQPMRHRLFKHPLLQLPEVIQLGGRHEKAGRVRTHSNEVLAGTPFNDAPGLHPNRKSAVETLSDLEHASAWMSLLNVQTDDLYRALVDEVLDSVKPEIDRRDPGMCYRAGWIFLSSPGTVTPFHMDTEHNFIVQIAGRKRLYVWEPDDVVAVSEAARDLFLDVHSRELIKWRDELRARAHVFELEPGIGAFMPSTSPHLVENYDNPSLTMSFTFYTDSTRRNALLHKLHNRMRLRGMNPAPVGERPLIDNVLHRAASSALAAKRTVRRLLGQPNPPQAPRYAVHRFS